MDARFFRRMQLRQSAHMRRSHLGRCGQQKGDYQQGGYPAQGFSSPTSRH